MPDNIDKLLGQFKKEADAAKTKLQVQLDDINKQKFDIKQKIDAEKDDTKKKSLQDELDTLQEKLNDIMANAGVEQGPVLPSFQEQQRQKLKERQEAEESAKEYARTHPEARKQFKDIQEATSNANKQVKKTAQNIIPGLKNKSVDDQIKELQLKRLKKESQGKPFELPDIPKDTATATVIGAMIATFFILAGVGTKFSQLWGYAFNAPISGAGPGGQPDDAWELPDPFKEIGA